MIKCPHCAHEMEEKLSSGITIDQCSNCKGLWFDTNELSAFCIMSGYNKEKVELAINQIEYLSKTEKIFCPRCKNQNLYLATTRFINILNCKNCNGIFLSSESIVRLLQLLGDKNALPSARSGSSFLGGVLGFGLEEIISEIFDF